MKVPANTQTAKYKLDVNTNSYVPFHNLVGLKENTYLDLLKEPDRDLRGENDLYLRGEIDLDLR